MRLLIVDDAHEMALAIARGLTRQAYAVDVAFSGFDALEAFQTNDYDLVILDLGLPQVNGIDLLCQMKTLRPEVLILVLTGRTRLEDRVLGLDQGADDYLCKPFHYDELLAHIRALLRRDLRTREPILKWRDLKIDLAGMVAWKGHYRLNLTRKEFALVYYLMRHAEETVSAEALLEHVWNSEANPFSNSVRVHINSLRQKLNDDAKNPTYIETIIGQGYRLGPIQDRQLSRMSECS